MILPRDLANRPAMTRLMDISMLMDTSVKLLSVFCTLVIDYRVGGILSYKSNFVTSLVAGHT